MSIKKWGLIISVSLLTVGGVAGMVYAEHSWGGYHWGRSANPFILELGDNVSESWSSSLATTSSGWSVSSVLDTVVVNGGARRNCRATDGRVEVCSAGYGTTGWLGIAQIWVSGGHIVKGIVKVNDTYFNTAEYDTPEWRNVVMCQEVGHTLGLGHVDEDFNNAPLGTCMDYSADPAPNQNPNQHDYEMLEEVYEHLDSVNTVKSGDDGNGGGKGNGRGGGKGKRGEVGQDIDLSDPSAWGRAVKEDARGNSSLFERDMGSGEKVFTFVTWK